jgi:LPXTG-motif cell wall-anchored protein
VPDAYVWLGALAIVLAGLILLRRAPSATA